MPKMSKMPKVLVFYRIKLTCPQKVRAYKEVYIVYLNSVECWQLNSDSG